MLAPGLEDPCSLPRSTSGMTRPRAMRGILEMLKLPAPVVDLLVSIVALVEGETSQGSVLLTSILKTSFNNGGNAADLNELTKTVLPAVFTLCVASAGRIRSSVSAKRDIVAPALSHVFSTLQRQSWTYGGKFKVTSTHNPKEPALVLNVFQHQNLPWVMYSEFARFIGKSQLSKHERKVLRGHAAGLRACTDRIINGILGLATLEESRSHHRHKVHDDEGHASEGDAPKFPSIFSQLSARSRSTRAGALKSEEGGSVQSSEGTTGDGIEMVCLTAVQLFTSLRDEHGYVSAFHDVWRTPSQFWSDCERRKDAILLDSARAQVLHKMLLAAEGDRAEVARLSRLRYAAAYPAFEDLVEKCAHELKDPESSLEFVETLCRGEHDEDMMGDLGRLLAHVVQVREGRTIISPKRARGRERARLAGGRGGAVGPHRSHGCIAGPRRCCGRIGRPLARRPGRTHQV